MANPKHLDILKQGVKVWNRWRRDNPEIQPDLSKADLSEANLIGINFFEADLIGTILDGADLSEASLESADLTDTQLVRTILRGTDFTGAILSGANLSGMNLAGVDLQGAAELAGINLSNSDLDGMDLSSEDLSGANFSNACLEQVNFDQAYLVKANLTGSDLTEASLRGTDLTEACLKEANLSEVDLFEANLSRANLSGAKLNWASLVGTTLDSMTEISEKWRLVWEVANKGAVRRILNETDLSDTYLGWVDFTGASLQAADLSDAILNKANFSEADLSEANFTGAELGGANFSKANLHEANLTNAYLEGADLNEALLYKANLDRANVGSTRFGDIDLRGVYGLGTIHHTGPSTLGIDTINRSHGQIPIAFLRGCGLSDLQIEMVKLHNPNLTTEQVVDITYKISELHAGKTIQYYSCFISHSSKDQHFAQRLYDDLQDNGVRCWFAPEDMKIGDKIRPVIDQSIRFHDKLLVILSKNSMQSDWVEDEVETAIEEEKKRQTTVLFPIRLDETVMGTDQAWAAKLRRTRHIGDFSRWKDHDAYQQAFERLLRDLKAEG